MELAGSFDKFVYAFVAVHAGGQDDGWGVPLGSDRGGIAAC